MPRANPFQNNFSSGEFRPELEGRVEIERYASALKTMRHFLVTISGGATRRYGTHYVAAGKDPDTRVRLIPFEFSDTQAYMLEMGDHYVRFYMNGGQILWAVTNGTFDTDLSGWTNVSAGGGVPPHSASWDAGEGGQLALFLNSAGSGLAKAQHTEALHGPPNAPVTVQFTVRTQAVRFVVGTFLGAGDILSSLATTYGPGTHAVTFITPATGRFYINFQRHDADGNGAGYVDNVRLLTSVPYEIVSPYAAEHLPKLKWVQSADVMYLVNPHYPVQKLARTGHTAWTLTPVTFLPPPTAEEPIKPAASLTPGATTGNDIVFTASASVFLAGDVDRQILSGVSRAVIQTVTSGTVVRCDILDAFPSTDPIASQSWSLAGSPNASLDPDKKEPKGGTATLTASLASFRAEDVGKYLKLNDGLVHIKSRSSTTVVKGEIVKPLSVDTAAAAGNWTLEVAAWSATRGYPNAVCFHEGRLVFGGSDSQPETIWGSEVGDFESMALGVDPADAYEFKIAANKVNIIRWLLPSRVLLVGTKGGEFRVTGGLDQAISPTNVDAKSETPYGSNFVNPVRVGAAILFAQRSGRKLRELAFSQDQDSYVAPELNVLAAHLLPIGKIIDEMDFQQDPEPVLWAVRSDGMLLSMTYDRSNNVVGWAQHPFDGAVESVCVIPHPDGDREQVWLAVRRTITGVETRYIEYLDDAGGFYGKINTDCTLTYSGSAVTTFGGLDHLRGKVVQILGDGAYYGEQTVPTTGAAEVVISPAAAQVEIGLPFTPTPTLEQLRAEVPSQSGSTQGQKKRLSKVLIRVLDTMGLIINHHVEPARRSTNLLGDPPSLFTGDYDGTKLGWDTEGRNLIQAPLPLPATVLGIFGTVDVAEN